MSTTNFDPNVIRQVQDPEYGRLHNVQRTKGRLKRIGTSVTALALGSVLTLAIHNTDKKAAALNNIPAVTATLHGDGVVAEPGNDTLFDIARRSAEIKPNGSIVHPDVRSVVHAMESQTTSDNVQDGQMVYLPADFHELPIDSPK